MLFAHDAGIDRPRRIDANGAAGGNLLMRGNTFQLNWLSVTRQKTRARCNPGLANGVASTEAHISESEASYREALAAETAGNWCSSIVSQLKAQLLGWIELCGLGQFVQALEALADLAAVTESPRLA